MTAPLVVAIIANAALDLAIAAIAAHLAHRGILTLRRPPARPAPRTEPKP